MNLKHLRPLLSILLSLSLLAVSSAQQTAPDPKESVNALLDEIKATAPPKNGFDSLVPKGAELKTFRVEGNDVYLVFNDLFGRRTWTPESRAAFESKLRAHLKGQIPDNANFKISLRYGNRDSVEYSFDDHITSPELIKKRQAAREAPAARLAAPVVDPVDYAGPPRTRGLANRNLVVAPSHGWTWHKENRWQLQRARVYTIVEDLLPMSFCNPFLIPMLENAGANVFSARERDFQTAEVIVDNDGVSALSEFTAEGEWTPTGAKGWNGPRPAVLAEGTEPFTLGSTLRTEVVSADQDTTIAANYIPYIPSTGRYAVYASWTQSPDNSPSVPVVVHHLGGSTTVRVNQQVAGATWVFLGFYEFAKGTNAETGRVSINARGAKPSEAAVAAGKSTFVTADAVRFGGGMGNIAPTNLISGKPRYAEGARYFLQYAGAPASLVYLLDFNEPHFGIDYWRDVASRAEWANYLNGAPNGPNGDRKHPGLGVPVDLFFDWHTDAGFDEQGLIGTLAIYRVRDQLGIDKFPDGRSRWLNRDLASLIQEELVRTARTEYTSTWARRALMEGNYGEARRGNVPSMLLESISHHNFNDMKYGNDPRFRRDTARAVYKAMVRFIAYSNGYDPIITPLEPIRLVVRQRENATAELTWQPSHDPLEPTAEPDGYIVYTSTDGKSFDNGRYVKGTSYVATDIPEGTTLCFRVTAANTGGESFPTPVVATRWVAGKKPVLIVDGFNRISGPQIVHEKDAQGFDRAADPGVGFHYNYGLVGDQYDWDPNSKWVNDLETPGMGASLGNMENSLEMGNLFNHVVTHGAALAAAGYTFDSATGDAFAAGDTGTTYRAIDWIAGRQKTIMPPAGMAGQGNPDRMRPEFETLPIKTRQRLANYLDGGGKLFISGAHIVEDLTQGGVATTESARFAEGVLGVKYYRSRATTTNAVRAAENHPFKQVKPFRFGRDLEPPINIEPTVYAVPSAESYVGTTDASEPLLEYGDTGLSAAVSDGTVLLMGFPLETVLPPNRRNDLVGAGFKNLGIEP